MRTLPLGPSDTISEIMLGTMTFGTQTSEAEAHAQLDLAADQGVTWLDTAELYPVNPVRAETLGVTEAIIGRWVAKGNRDRLKIATKICGEGSPARGGAPITPASIHEAVAASLKRLQTETIDLYQLHWPNRGSFQFRQNWTYRPQGDKAAILQDMADCEGALAREVERGTIRAFGLSNESAWGLARWVDLAEGGPTRPVSVQNEYSIMARLGDTDLAETLAYEGITMLAFSPLVTGLITGKYQGDRVPDGSRRSFNADLGGRWTDRVQPTVAAYLEIARTHGLDPIHMALAWLQSRPFRCSAILGATTLDQLTHALKAQDRVLSEDTLAAIDTAHKAHPMPF